MSHVDCIRMTENFYLLKNITAKQNVVFYNAENYEKIIIMQDYINKTVVFLVFE